MPSYAKVVLGLAVVLTAGMKSGRAADAPEPVVLKGHTKAVSAVA
jgi:hypothetical protein